MQLIRHLNRCPDACKSSVLTLGNFDGVHRGHLAVLKETKKIAVLNHRPAAVMSFEPHPLKLLRPEVAVKRLTPPAEKLALFRENGIDIVFCPHFNTHFASISGPDFIEEILIRQLEISHLVIGHDFIFGHKRSGNAALLKEYCFRHGIGFTQLTPVSESHFTPDGIEPVIFSSTRIRKALQSGDLCTANLMLGRPYHLAGRVRHGEKRGRNIGFPTANIRPHPDMLLPTYGVYAVIAVVDGNDTPLPAIANLGTRPTFDDHTPLLEVHLLDSTPNLYGKRMQVFLQNFIRPEKKFDSPESLKTQIRSDIEHARHFLATMHDSPIEEYRA